MTARKQFALDVAALVERFGSNSDSVVHGESSGDDDSTLVGI